MSEPDCHDEAGLLENPPGWALARGDEPAVRIDLHCHSRYSHERLRYLPGLTFHPLLEPLEVYQQAKRRGMDFVTITDHDTIDGCKALLDACGGLDDFIVGEEVSVRFPEDGTVIHVNVYDIDETQHAEIQRLRENIYDLTDYLRRIDKLYVLNHMTWTAQHRVLRSWQIDVMLERFDVFEGINGTRSYAHNAFVWQATRGRGKVLVGGSDSHSHRMGTTWTITRGRTRAELIENIRRGVAAPGGAFGTAEKLYDDVWLVLQKNIERRLADASGVWQRFACRAVRRVGQVVRPLACFGYTLHQNMLIRRFERVLAV